MGLLQVLKGEQPGIIQSLLHYENVGQLGEFYTEFALTNHNLDGNFTVLNNVYLPKGNGTTTEIDLLMLHEKGIFVFESKNYSGWIFGAEDQAKWTQCLRGGKKYTFYNPILQNRSHIRSLSAFLKLPDSAFTSFIVFSERCSLKSVPANTKDVIICRRPKMLSHIRTILRDAPILYSMEQLCAMNEKLSPFTNVSADKKLQHIEDIESKCPLCGAYLVLRSGKYGSFWGCSSYPKCRYTRNL